MESTQVYPGTSLNIIFALVIILLSLKLHTYYEPYMDVTDNDLTEAFHWVFIFLFISALVISSEKHTGGWFVDTFISASLISGLCAVVYMIVYEVHREKHTIGFLRKKLGDFRRKVLARCGCHDAATDAAGTDGASPRGSHVTIDRLEEARTASSDGGVATAALRSLEREKSWRGTSSASLASASEDDDSGDDLAGPA